ncbi:MAG: hypothetical protein ACFE0Q_15415 [Anaerolineae bacterium]
MDNEAPSSGQVEQSPDINTTLGLSASVDAAAAFVGFQETISLIEERLDTRATSKVDMLYNNFLTLKSEFNSLKSRVDRLTGANGADNPAFQGKDRTTADGTSFSE